MFDAVGVVSLGYPLLCTYSLSPELILRFSSGVGAIDLVRTANIPALYIFPKRLIDVEHASQTMCEEIERLKRAEDVEVNRMKSCTLMWDVAYSHEIGMHSLLMTFRPSSPLC